MSQTKAQLLGSPILGDLSFDNGTLAIDSVNNRIGVNATDPISKLEIRGTGNASNGSTSLGDSVSAASIFLKPQSGSSTGLALGGFASGGHYIQGVYSASTATAVRDISLNPYGANIGIGIQADNFGAVPGTSNIKFGTSGTLRATMSDSGFSVVGDVTADNFLIGDAYPVDSPIMDMNFSRDKKLDSKITFTRDSVATYFDAENTEKLEQNFMTYSNDFSQWDVAGGSLSTSSWANPFADASLPNPYLFTEDTGSATHRLYYGFQHHINLNDQDYYYTISFFAKYNSGRQYLQLNASGLSANSRIIFDIQNGSVSDQATAVRCGVQDYGNGWYRCWATVSVDTNAPVNTTITCPVGGNSSQSGNGESYTGNGSSWYIWGYQIEIGDTLGEFVPTYGNRIERYGPVIRTVEKNEPRFVSDPESLEPLGLLIEQGSTNVHPYSHDLNTAIVTTGGSSNVKTLSYAGLGLDGKLEAGKVMGNGVSGSQRIYFNYSCANNTSAAWSVFVKKGGGSPIIQFYTNTYIASNSALNVDLTTGNYNAVTPSNDLFYTVEKYPRGWYRVTFGGTNTSGSTTNGSMNINLVDSLSSARASSSASSASYFIWGIQYETGSLKGSTSYIENRTGSTKSRSDELAQITGSSFSSWYPSESTTVLAEYRGGYYSSEIPIHISRELDTANTNIQIGSSSSGPIPGYVTTVSIVNQGTSQASWIANTATPSERENIKTIVTYGPNYANMATTDGSSTYIGSADTSVNLPGLNMITIGKDSYYGIWNNKPIKRLAFYGRIMSDAEMLNLLKF